MLFSRDGYEKEYVSLNELVDYFKLPEVPLATGHYIRNFRGTEPCNPFRDLS